MNAVMRCQKAEGLYNRSLTKKEQNGPDDYIGVATASRWMDAPFARYILLRGMLHRFFCFRWIYNNVVPGQFTGQAWFGRMPHVIAHFHWCAGIEPNPFLQLYWAMAIIWSGLFGKRQGTILEYLMVESAIGGMAVDVARDIWRWGVGHRWGTSHMRDPVEFAMRCALQDELGMDHPIVRYWL